MSHLQFLLMNVIRKPLETLEKQHVGFIDEENSNTKYCTRKVHRIMEEGASQNDMMDESEYRYAIYLLYCRGILTEEEKDKVFQRLQEKKKPISCRKKEEEDEDGKV